MEQIPYYIIKALRIDHQMRSSRSRIETFGQYHNDIAELNAFSNIIIIVSNAQQRYPEKVLRVFQSKAKPFPNISE